MPEPPARATTRRAVLAAGLLAPLAGCAREEWREGPSVEVRLATGNPGGVFDVYGEALAAAVRARVPRLRVRTLETDASVANTLLVSRGRVDLGFSLGDTAADALRGTGQFEQPLDLVALTRTYDSFVHLVVRDDSPVESLPDLRGRRVGLGAMASGTRVVAQRLCRVADVPLGSLSTSATTLREDAAALAAGEIDAFFFVSGLPNTTVADLADRMPVRLVPLGDLVAPMVERHGPEYVAGPIPAATYGLADGTDTVSVKNYLIARADLDADVAYAVTRVLYEAQDEIERRAPEVRQPNVAAGVFTSPLELHPGALRWFRGLRPD